MIRDITLGQYFPGDSWVHKLDPRIKIIATLLFIIELFIVDNFIGFRHSRGGFRSYNRRVQTA